MPICLNHGACTYDHEQNLWNDLFIGLNIGWQGNDDRKKGGFKTVKLIWFTKEILN